MGGHGVDSSCSVDRRIEGCCENGKGHSGSIKSRNFLTEIKLASETTICPMQLGC